MTDNELFREVDEELRRERLAKLWSQYGTYIVATAAAVVIGVAGFKGWEQWSTNRAQQAGAEFVAAEALLDAKKNDDAKAAFEKLQSEGPSGYRILAKLKLAAASAGQGNTADAVKAYDEVAKNSSASSILQGLAKIQAATLRVDEADFREIKSRLQGMNTPQGHWRNSARELVGLSAYKAKDFDVAKTQFQEILGDQNAPENIRKRAEMMMALIVGASK